MMFDRIRSPKKPTSQSKETSLSLTVNPENNNSTPKNSAEVYRPTLTDGPLTFVNSQPDELYESARNSEKGNIVRTLTEQPVDGVTLHMSSDEEHFKLLGTIEYPSSKDGKEIAEQTFDKISQHLAMRALAANDEIIERGGNIIVQGDNGTQIVVGRGRGYSQENKINVSTGEIKEGYDDSVEILPPLKLSRETFDSAVSDILGIMTTALYVSYDTARKPIPKQQIRVTPPQSKETSYAFPGAGEEKGKTPESISNEFGVERPEVSFDDIGGQDEAKNEIKSLAFALSNPDLYKKWGTTPPKGVLLYGEPGTGKTLLAKALASEVNAPFYSITANDITSKWYGHSEKRVQKIFDKAAEDDSAIIYLDEIDAIIPNRNGSHEASQRVISIILQNMDGMKTKGNVMIVASTNRKDSIDPAMLRPGRLDRIIEVKLPDEQGRHQVFDIHIAKANSLAERNLFDENIDIGAISSDAVDFSGADIAEIIRRTLEKKVRDEGLTGVESSLVTMDDILTELKAYERIRKTTPEQE
ncbi:MAG TPA: AAA family ATPase [Candidatus Saccharimonadales bacterium]|nr:AAA family ATPase [Candidatus Saccharimonadales bacterium]